MRLLKIIEHISLDGVIQGPGGVDEDRDEGFSQGGWITGHRDPAIMEVITATHGSAFDLLLGRRTYDIWSGYWPEAGASELSQSINRATKYVATSMPESLKWGPVQSIGPDVASDVRRLKETQGPDIVLWGSSSLPTALLEHSLADEVVLIVYPVLLGNGKRFFTQGSHTARLALLNTQVTASGVVISRYRPSKEA